MSTSSRARLEAEVRGRVQGVGFRHFTTQTARSAGLNGWVRNEPDGTVRLVAEGDRTDLEALLQQVKEGPRTARVDGVQATWHDATDDFDAFEVRR